MQEIGEPRIVQDLEGDDTLVLVQTDHEIRAILQHVTIPEPRPWWFERMVSSGVYGCLFVEVGDGDYKRIYVCEGDVPYAGREVFRVR